ncbi:MAG: sugar phosphate isomerase/epimerase [Dehalococcoidia bacterium]|nr:sugar phosphate isomerase/epimerase [Dehalococcoidia bacterium]
MKYCICSDTFPGWTVEEIFQYAAETGYEAVELASYSFCDSITEVSAPERQQIRAWADAADINIAGMHALFTPIPNMQPLHSCPAWLQLNSADPVIRDKTKDYLKELIRFCGEVGGTNVVLGSAKSRSIPEEIPYEQGWAIARDTLRECAEYAVPYDVVLSLEPIHKALTNFINTPDDAMKMVKDVDHPNLMWMLDCFAAYNQGVDVPKAVRAYGKYLAHVHMNDENKSWPGTGKIDFPPIAQALKDVGYNGYLSVEVMDLHPDPETIGREALKALQKYFG